jgi:hypothetical protein
MRPRLSALIILALLTGLPSVASAERATLVAELSGSGQAGGDPDGSGRAAITLDTARLSLCYALTATGIAPPTTADIRRGAATETGRPVVRLVAPRDGESRKCVEVTAYDANELLRHPEAFYVNVRTEDFPAGALRGQLQR